MSGAHRAPQAVRFHRAPVAGPACAPRAGVENRIPMSLEDR